VVERPSLDFIKTNSADEKTGVDIIRKSIEAPLRQIAQNAGKTGEVYVEKVKEQTGNFGYNVKTDKIEDLVEAGIIDATKVIRVALENAVSVANMVIISECLVVEVG
jgi:chaperonin GroEL